jgi:DtxR family Mn-dependent transcriptional regulator
MTTEKKYPIPTPEQEDIEEALGAIWHQYETGVYDKASVLPVIEEAVDAAAYPRLLSLNLAREEDGRVVLTGEGEKLAKDVTRRHRLAERLLSDVLALSGNAIDPNACQLEHTLSTEVAESICTLLGHPKECPHGSPIPRGECCGRELETVEPIIASLDHLEAGEKGRIAYLLIQNHPDLHKLLSLGLIPGTEFSLHQTYPTLVLEFGQTTIALEKEIAAQIFVRRDLARAH